MATVLIIPDTHAPFEHPDTLDFLKYVRDRFKPDTVVHIGDEVDMCGLSSYTKNPDGLSAGHEHEKALVFMKKLYRLFPAVTVCTANHTARIFKRAMDIGIPKAFLKSYAEFLEAPSGWKWVENLEIDEVLYEHGEGSRGGHFPALDLARLNMQSTVIGHFHTQAGVQYYCTDKKILWGLSVGCLIDVKTYAFEYSKVHKRKPALGCGIVKNGHPLFVPMIISKNGRWNKKANELCVF